MSTTKPSTPHCVHTQNWEIIWNCRYSRYIYDIIPFNDWTHCQPWFWKYIPTLEWTIPESKNSQKHLSTVSTQILSKTQYLINPMPEIILYWMWTKQQRCGIIFNATWWKTRNFSLQRTIFHEEKVRYITAPSRKIVRIYYKPRASKNTDTHNTAPPLATISRHQSKMDSVRFVEP